MVTDESIDKILIVCDRKYAEKANKRSGGVGTETQIISAKVYQSVKQSKFVVVIAERDEEGKAPRPTYYASRIYIDLSTEELYPKNFEQLLRWIYDKPLHTKPELGKPPGFLQENNVIFLGTDVVFKRAIDAIKNGKIYADGAVSEYFQTYASNLEKFRLNSDKQRKVFDDAVVENIELFIPYRNQMIELFIVLAQYIAPEKISRHLITLLESLIPYMYPKERSYPRMEGDFDNYRFIIEEIFLYAIAILLKHEHFSVVSQLVTHNYYSPSSDEAIDYRFNDFAVFHHHLRSLERINERNLNQKLISLHANFLKERCTGLGINFESIQQADFVLFLLKCQEAINEGESRAYWYPKTLIYRPEYSAQPFEIFYKAQSKRYFERLKCVFNVENKTQLSRIFTAFEKGILPVPKFGLFNTFSPSSLAGFDKLCTKP